MSVLANDCQPGPMNDSLGALLYVVHPEIRCRTSLQQKLAVNIGGDNELLKTNKALKACTQCASLVYVYLLRVELYGTGLILVLIEHIKISPV